ncbi:MAG: hypothetical protein H7Y13_00630 [Sphingobacteriaceae bacterium]|nr:hypothetical protein [Sphingobacteriaceae bacterium]
MFEKDEDIEDDEETCEEDELIIEEESDGRELYLLFGDELDPFFTTAARLIVLLNYDLERLESALSINPLRFKFIKLCLLESGLIDELGNPLVEYEKLEEIFRSQNLT